jgi:hypothetical protein
MPVYTSAHGRPDSLKRRRIALYVDFLPHLYRIQVFHPLKKTGKHFSLYEETQSKFLTLKILNV